MRVAGCAGDHLYKETRTLVYGVALRMLPSEADAEEVTLDVYTQVWRTAPGFNSVRGSVAAWLVTITRSRAIDRLRSRASRAREEQPWEEHAQFDAREAGPEEQSRLGQRKKKVAAALGALPREQKEALELAFFSELSHTELAAKLHLPLGTVKTRIRAGMIKMRELLEA